MAALTRTEGFPGGVDLLGSGQIIEEGITRQCVKAVILDRTIGKANAALDIITIEHRALIGIADHRIDMHQPAPVRIVINARAGTQEVGLAIRRVAVIAVLNPRFPADAEAKPLIGIIHTR